MLFGPPGHLYVYFTYGMHFCANVACEPEGTGAGVLLRALDPEHGLERMVARRGVDEPRLLCSGPARLAQALGIGREQNGLPVWSRLSRSCPSRCRRRPSRRVVTTARIGVRGGDQKPWRFVDAGSRVPLAAAARADSRDLPAGSDRAFDPSRSAGRAHAGLTLAARAEQKGPL